MAMREGLCPNCGSLMRVNDENETTYCIFCWAPVNSEEAIRLASEPGTHEYANKSYPEPSPEEKAKALQAQGFGGAHVLSQVKTPAKKPVQEKAREGKLTPREKVALQNKPLVKPYCSKEHRIRIILGILIFLAVLAAIALPTYFMRENKKTEIMKQMSEVAPYAAEKNRVNIERQQNQLVTIISPDKTSETAAKEVFDKYTKIYAKVYGIDEAAAKEKVTLNLLDDVTGGYQVVFADGADKVTALK